MKIVLPFLFAMTVSPEQVRFEMELDFPIRQVFLESIVMTFTGVSRPDVCANHCVGHQNCSAFGLNTNSNACQRFGDVLIKESAALAPLVEGQRYYFIKKGYENTFYHVGASDAAKEGTWVWSDGTPLTMKWHNGEPNGNNTENCLMVYQGKGHDVPCIYNTQKSLCELTGK